MDVTGNGRNLLREFLEEFTEEEVTCKIEESELPVEECLEDLIPKEDNSFITAKVDDSFENFYGEEEGLVDEKIQNTPDGIEEVQQEDGSLKPRQGNHQLENITFEDKDMSKSDMFVCKECHRVFISKYKLGSHRFRVHGAKKAGRPKKVERLNRRKELTQEHWTPDVQKLAKRVNNTKVFICDQCPYTVSRCDSMTKHVLRVHSRGLVKPQYMCEFCGKTFIDMAYLRNHGLSHIEEPQFFCEICGRRFHRQPSLKRHIQSHSEEKQFSCSLCDYKTNRKHLMYNHAENHRTGKAYSCKFCLAKFYTQMSLRKHTYMQHATRYACSFCKIGFSSRERMWSHMQKIHFTCEVKDLKTDDLEKQDEVKVEYIEVKMEPKAILSYRNEEGNS